MQIEIRQEHIDAGLRQNATKCPIAMALNDRYGEGYGAEVGANTIRLFRHDPESPCMSWVNRRTEQHARFFHNRSTRAFMRRFDDGRPVKPCTIELED